MNPKILFLGNFSKNEVICKYLSGSQRKIDPKIEKQAKQTWQRNLKTARKLGRKMWDQPVYRLDEYSVGGGGCRLAFSVIPFSIRSGLMDFSKELVKKGKDYFPMATYSSIFVETADGKFLFGVKSDKFLTNRHFSYIGGVFNRVDGDCFTPQLFESALNETREELGVIAKDIDEFKLIGAFRSRTFNVGFIFYCKLKHLAATAKIAFDKKHDLELKNLAIVDKDDLEDFCVNKIGKEVEMFRIFERFANE